MKKSGKQRRRKDIKNVALVIEMSNEYSRGILLGIHDYIIDRHSPWSLYLTEHGRHEIDHSFARVWRGDGIIARIETSETAGVIKRMKVPAIDVSAARLIDDIPWVETDDKAITDLAIAHLMDCGLHNFAFVSDPFYNWSKWRRRHFIQAMEEKKVNYTVFDLPLSKKSGSHWFDVSNRIVPWLRRLPKPVGIFACYDMCGHQLLEVCRQHKIPVPEDVAVIGVDNDSLLCNLSTPSLSSVIPDSRRTGYHAAELLDRLMAGHNISNDKRQIKPLGVQMRISTDMVAVAEPLIAKSIAYIRKHAFDNINVSDVLQQIPLSRRVFESRFKRALNRTPHEEILRIRVNSVRKLLSETEKPLAEIAEIMNLEHPEYLNVFFKKQTGLTPLEYRRKTQNRIF